MSGVARLALALAICMAGACDRFDPPARADADAGAASPREAEARSSAREALASVMKAAAAVTSRCVAGELRWEADADGNLVASHYSRPCIPERCTPDPAQLDALRASVRSARALVDREPSLQVPSYEGLVALAEAMIRFTDTALAGSAGPERIPSRLSGLSMHYGALAAAYHELYPDADVPLAPPSLVASLAGPQPGGDPCKGWAKPARCDVRAVRVHEPWTWRSDPPCIEVEPVPK